MTTISFSPSEPMLGAAERGAAAAVEAAAAAAGTVAVATADGGTRFTSPHAGHGALPPASLSATSNILSQLSHWMVIMGLLRGHSIRMRHLVGDWGCAVRGF